MNHIKTEPLTEKPKWCLIAVSEAARKWRNRFELQPNQSYVVGRSRSNDIYLPSPFCSKKQCTLQVTADEVIMKDQSTHGTRVNRVNFKNSRCILSDGDWLGFGCNTITKHNKNKNDRRYYVYRLALGTGIQSELIELSDSSDDNEINQPSNQFNDSYQDGNATDDECQSADEMDVKPDIHSLMRETYAKIQIKEEINYNCYEYEKSKNTDQINPDAASVETVYLSDSEDDVVTVEPARKRIRQDNIHDGYGQTENQTKPNANEHSSNAPDTKLDKINKENQICEQIPEYQMSETTLKEKVKNVVRSRGQQLATDMLMPKNALLNNLNEPSTSTQTTKANKMVQMTAKSQAAETVATPNAYAENYTPEHVQLSIEELTNVFITEVTKWDFKWIYDKKPNPLQYSMEYKMEVKPLGTNFSDLSAYQRQMKMLLLMETYSIVFKEYHSQTKSQNIFTNLKFHEYNFDLKRYVYKCFAQNSECRISEIRPADYVIVALSKGKFLAYVTQAQRTTDGWEFELQAFQVDKNKNQVSSKFLQVAFITNIETMLECYISLYELKNSSLQEMFLHPSSQLEEEDEIQSNEASNFKVPISSKIYEKCAISLFGGSKILLVNGGAGTGKTVLIRDVLHNFANENFQYTKSILVCGMNNTLVDNLAEMVLPKIKNIARFGKISMMKNSIRPIGVEKLSQKLQDVDIVFAPINNAVDLLHANISFDVCIVDDAALCPEAEILPLFRLKLNTLLLVGDDKLQTSMILNECCRENGYSLSLFSRVIASYDQFDSKKRFVYSLEQQHRMHESIYWWPNKYFYKNKMKKIRNARVRACTFTPYTVFQVNNIEDIEIDFMEKLLKYCVKQMHPRKFSYGIVCGHPDSKTEIETLLKSNAEFSGIEVSGYDSFQGQEKDIIIITALKPTDGFELVSTKESLSIALTRAKDCMIFCGNFQHVTTKVDSMTSVWDALLGDAKARNCFVDLNGVFDEQLIDNLIPRARKNPTQSKH